MLVLKSQIQGHSSFAPGGSVFNDNFGTYDRRDYVCHLGISVEQHHYDEQPA